MLRAVREWQCAVILIAHACCQKLGTVIKAAAASSGGAKAAAPAAKKKSTSNLQSAALFAQIEDAIKSDGANLVKKVRLFHRLRCASRAW